MRASYLWNARESLPRRIALAPLCLIEAPYRLGAWAHRSVFRSGLRRRVRLDPCIVSIGNLCVGGSGKTPLAGWLASELRARGRGVAILSRGVGGRLQHETSVVSDGERVLLGSRDVGDEPVLLAGRARGVPVLAGRNRVALGLRAAALFGPEILILDDGFQHHRLARDLDLVCLDARLGLGNRHGLPRGPLRESISALRYADAVVWTRIPPDAKSLPSLPDAAAGKPEYGIEMVARGLRRVGAVGLAPVSSLRGQKIGLLAAIARPDRLRDELVGLGAEIAVERFFADHHHYRRSDLASLDPGIPWVTTEKDAVKIPASWVTPATLSILEEEVRPWGTGHLINLVLERVQRRGAER